MCECGKAASFADPGKKRPTHCKACKTADMVDVFHPKCRCGTGDSFAAPGSKMPTHCASCKIADMVSVNGRQCPCGKTASFGLPGSTKRTHCASCKTADMVRLTGRQCPCGKTASFALPGSTKRTHCASCKSADMVSVIKQRRRTMKMADEQLVEESVSKSTFTVRLFKSIQDEKIGVCIIPVPDTEPLRFEIFKLWPTFGLSDPVSRWNYENPSQQVRPGQHIQ